MTTQAPVLTGVTGFPEHWVVTRLGRDISVSGGLVDPRVQPWLDTVLIAPNHIESGTGRLLATETAREQGASSGKYVARRGQVLYSKIRPALNKVALAPQDCLCSADMYALSPRSARVDARYLAYWLLGFPFAAYARLTADRVKMPKINQDELGRGPWARPPLAEQLDIVEFLDRETAQIDLLIAEQERLIALLSERRTAVQHAAVTGAGVSGVRRPSGLAWAQSVPEHWEVANIRRFAVMKTGHTPSRSEPRYWEDCTIPWFTLADVHQLRSGRQMYVDETESLISELGLANSAAELLPARTVVLSRTASVGFTGVTTRPMATSQDYWNWVCSPRLLPEFLVYTFRAMRDEFAALMRGSTHKTIYQPVAAALRIPVPPLREQHQIVDDLRGELARIDELIDEVREHISLARERRAALITAAVTGQIELEQRGA